MPASTGPDRTAEDARAIIEGFLQTCRSPALLEPGEEPFPLQPDGYAIECRNGRLTIQAWDTTRNLVRRVTGVREESPGRLELAIERFARKPGRLFLIDRDRRAGKDLERRGARFVFGELFGQMLRRQFPDWKLVESTTSADLEHSLSAVHPRAFLRKGARGWAAVAAPPGDDGASVLAFGLIWLDYLRRRERRVTVEGLALFLPAGAERVTALRLAWLNPDAARYELFSYAEEGYAARVDLRDLGNLDTRLEICRTPCAEGFARVLSIPGTERVDRHDGAVSLRVRGIEFARVTSSGIRVGLQERVPAGAQEMEALARELAARRSPSPPDAQDPIFRQAPEAWLESQVRGGLRQIDGTLVESPVYGQVPAFAGGNRGIMDLLAVDHRGRLAVLELKASADLQLPLQALDYWMRVKWHLDRDEFGSHGYFPGISLRSEAPRLLLVSPALEFHPTTEVVLSYLSRAVDVERIGLGVEWRRKLSVMFRLAGSAKP